MADSERDVPHPGRPDPRRTTPPTDSRVDPEGASPLGRGANPGPVEGTEPLSTKPGALHGGDVPGARGGPEGILARENEDARTRARRS